MPRIRRENRETIGEAPSLVGMAEAEAEAKAKTVLPFRQEVPRNLEETLSSRRLMTCWRLLDVEMTSADEEVFEEVLEEVLRKELRRSGRLDCVMMASDSREVV